MREALECRIGPMIPRWVCGRCCTKQENSITYPGFVQVPAIAPQTQKTLRYMARAVWVPQSIVTHDSRFSRLGTIQQLGSTNRGAVRSHSLLLVDMLYRHLDRLDLESVEVERDRARVVRLEHLELVLEQVRDRDLLDMHKRRLLPERELRARVSAVRLVDAEHKRAP
jgi:hypothetical protein